MFENIRYMKKAAFVKFLKVVYWVA